MAILVKYFNLAKIKQWSQTPEGEGREPGFIGTWVNSWGLSTKNIVPENNIIVRGHVGVSGVVSGKSLIADSTLII